jgi:hypothetical protein
VFRLKNVFFVLEISQIAKTSLITQKMYLKIPASMWRKSGINVNSKNNE